MPLNRRLVGVLAGSLLAGLLAAVPAHANFVGVGQDPAGDAADPSPGRDIVAVGLSYDRRTGQLRGGVRLRGAIDTAAPANLSLFAGRRTASGCTGGPAVGFVTLTDGTGVNWMRVRAPGAAPDAIGRATKRYDSTSEEYEATDLALADLRPNCVVATLTAPGDTAVVYDAAGPFALRGLPELEVSLGRVPARLRPSRTYRIPLRLRNAGDGPTGRLRLRATRARGLTVRLPRSLPGLRAGARRTVVLRVTLSGRAQVPTALRLTARGADRLRVAVERNLLLRAPSRRGGGGGGRSGTRLCFGYTWLPPFSELRPC